MFKIFDSHYDQDDARRRFWPSLEDRRAYTFQYYIWPESCSLRYHTHACLLAVVAFLYLCIIYYAISEDSFDNLQANGNMRNLFRLVLVWFGSLFFNNLQDILYQVLTNRKVRADFNLVLDIMLVIGILL